ncbi:nuclear transport factor 2 family protein [Herbiconiux solani]|uniref:nuclear transport factor 2 family protein n=1 Tax=Herbiconiux solani TaxID=661329 RepID=UPI0008265B0B|nr:nuclear transport factor 2 family protein [Herbiconiux solani]
MIDAGLAAEAVQVLNRYFRLLDERSFEVHRFAEVFADDGVVLRPNGTSMTGPTEIVESHRVSFARFAATQHLLTGHDVEPEGDGLSVRANLVAMHLWAENANGVISGPDDFFVAGAVITASLVRSPAGLRIARLVNTNVWKGGSGFGSMAATLGRP